MPSDHVPATGCIGTVWTFVGLLAGVRSLMSTEVIGPAEHLVAYLARVRLYACMQPHVSRQHIRPGEAPLAHVTEICLSRSVLRALLAMPRRHVFR